MLVPNVFEASSQDGDNNTVYLSHMRPYREAEKHRFLTPGGHMLKNMSGQKAVRLAEAEY